MRWIYLKSSVNAPCLVSLFIPVIDTLTTEVSFKERFDCCFNVFGFFSHQTGWTSLISRCFDKLAVDREVGVSTWRIGGNAESKINVCGAQDCINSNCKCIMNLIANIAMEPFFRMGIKENARSVYWS